MPTFLESGIRVCRNVRGSAQRGAVVMVDDRLRLKFRGMSGSDKGRQPRDHGAIHTCCNKVRIGQGSDYDKCLAQCWLIFVPQRLRKTREFRA